MSVPTALIPNIWVLVLINPLMLLLGIAYLLFVFLKNSGLSLFPLDIKIGFKAFMVHVISPDSLSS